MELVGEVSSCEQRRGDEHCSSEEDKSLVEQKRAADACTVNRRPVDVSCVIGRFGRFTVGRRRGTLHRTFAHVRDRSAFFKQLT